MTPKTFIALALSWMDFTSSTRVARANALRAAECYFLEDRLLGPLEDGGVPGASNFMSYRHASSRCHAKISLKKSCMAIQERPSACLLYAAGGGTSAAFPSDGEAILISYSA